MYKKILIATFGLLLIGAGCLGSQDNKAEVVEGDWWVTFELPTDWVVYAHYVENDSAPQLASIDRELTDIVVQSTDLPVVLNGQEAHEDLSEFVDSNYTYIRALRYDVGLTRIPDDAVELENGFYKREREDKPVEYWMAGEYGNYRFMITQEDQDLSVAEDVIFTAQEVTEIEIATKG